MEKEHTQTSYKSYKSLYSIKPVLFYVGDIKLPFPINVEMALVFVLNVAINFILFVKLLGSILVSLGLVPWMIALAVAALFTWITSQFDAAGKFIPLYIFDAAAFLIRPKRNTLLGKIKISNKKHTCKWKVDVR